MPVSLSEWRVRIGTFVQWIKEYEVKERRERLLKERIRRLKVLCERLEAKIGDSGEESEDDKSRQDGPDRKGCPHKSLNIRSSGNSSDIKDLLTSCDQCIQELLTASDSHIKELLIPSDTCSKQSLTPRRERLQRIQRLKVLCERLEAKMGDSGEESEDDKSRQDGPAHKGCPHKTANIRSSGNSSEIKDLLTSCDQCIQELLTTSNYHIKEILTPSDTCIEQLLTPRRERLQRIRRLKVLCERLEAKMGDSGKESEDDKSRQDDPDPKICPHKTLNIRSSGNSSIIKDLLTSCDQCIQDLLTASDSHIKEILTHSGSSIKELITPNECSITSPNTLNDSTIKEIITPNNSGIKELVATNDSRITNLVKANDDSRIQGLFIANDGSRIQDLLTTNYSSTSDQITPKYCSLPDVIISKKPDTPNNSSIIDLITSEYSHVKDLITSNDSKIDSLLHVRPNETNIKRLIKPDGDYIEEQLAQAYDHVKTVRTSDDKSIRQNTQVGDSREQHMSDFSISPHHSLPDASLRELLTFSYPSMKGLQTPTDDLNADLIIQTSYVKDYENQSDGSVKELLSPGSGTTVCQPVTPCDDFLVELVKPTVSASKDLPSIDLCWHEPDRQNEPLSEESGKFPYFVGQEQHLQHDTITKEATDDELLKEHHTSSGSCQKSQTETCIIMAVKPGPVVPFVSRKNCISDRHGEMGASCHGPSLKSKTDLISGQIPPLSELLLLKSGDVELNPGPRDAAGWSLELERELLLLVEEFPLNHYTHLCNALGVRYNQSQSILSKNLLDMSKSLFEVICSWGDKQRDGTNYKTLLAEKLRSVHLHALGRKLVEGGYSTQDTPTQDPILDTSQPSMTEAQVIQCGEDLKTFYREELCKIKPDPLDFNVIFEFEHIYTNLTLLRNEMGARTKTPLDYTNLLTTKINGVIPKRLLVEGEGGVGKTTFCSKIAWDWVNKSPEFQCFSWVLVIPLRNVVKGQTIGDIMKNYLPDNNAVNPKQIDNYISSQPTKVLIVLDGLDEYDGDLSAKDITDISQILRLEKFKQCIVLVTTRPWRAYNIKSKEKLSMSYAFIAVEGFSTGNVSTYISKYFVNDEKAGSELSRFIKVNDVIKENMAPFPIYVAMLCILWENCDSEKRETIRRLKTFSQLFEQMIMFLGDHYVSKVAKVLEVAHLDKEMENIKLCLQKIGSIAFSGLLKKKLVFNEEDFSSCKEAMETCCRIGVLSRENRNVSRWKRTVTASQPINTSVFFPHKLFQEYVAAVYLAFLYDMNRDEYSRSMGEVMSNNPQEFRYLLYFTAALGKEVGLDIVQKIQKHDVNSVISPLHLTRPIPGHFSYEQPTGNNFNFLVDVTFEAYNKVTAKAVGQRIFADERVLTIDKDMPAHTISGYLFIMEQHGMETLVFRDRSCGPTVSRDLADVLFTSNSLSRLEFYRTTLDHDFYKLMHTQVSTMAEDTSSIKELVVDHQFLDGLQRINDVDLNVTIGDLFPSLTQLTFTTLHTVSPGDVERLAHSSLAVLSIEHGKKGGKLVPLIGEPASLGLLFSSSFPQLTCLTFRELVMGNIRSEAILRNLKNHLHLKSISIIDCFTDDELEPLAEQITTENRMKILLQHDMAQRMLYFDSSIGPLTIDMIDALCHRTCVHHLEMHNEGVEIAEEECFPDLHGREVDSKIQQFTITYLRLNDDQSPSYCLGKFLSILPHLTDLTIDSCSFHDDFFKEIADRVSSCRIQKFIISRLHLENYQSSSRFLGKFLSLLSQLTDLTIDSCSLHNDFYKEIADRASSCRIQKIIISSLHLHGDQSSSRWLGKFLSLLPHLTHLTIYSCSFHDDFYKEIDERASSSQIQKFIITRYVHDDHGCRCVTDTYSSGEDDLFIHSPLMNRYYVRIDTNDDDQSSSYCLGKFLSLLPHLTHLEIDSCSLNDDFYKEIADQASLSQIQKFIITCLYLQDDQSASYCVGKFLSLLPHLTDLKIRHCYLHGEFYKEISDEASSSQIQKCIISDLHLRYDQSSSYCLGKFLSLLPHLTDLKIYHCTLHDDFYKEIADQASSSQIQTVNLDFSGGYDLPVQSQSAAKQLAKFLCSLPCLTNLEIFGNECLHDNFFTELASLAASSQIQTIYLAFSWNHKLRVQSHSASKQLAKFLCSLPCLTTLVISGNQYLHDDFFTYLESIAASSQNYVHLSCQNPYFRQKQHISMLQEWSVRKQRQQQQQQQQQQQRWLEQQQQKQLFEQQRQQQQLNLCEMPTPSTHQEPHLPHHVPLLESAQPSGQFQSDPHRGIQSEPQHVLESPREGRHHSLHPSSGEASQHSGGQGSGYSSGGHTGFTSFPLSSQTLNLDMPSTSESRSRSRSTQRRQGAAPVESERIPEHRKRIHSDEAKDDGDRVDESLEQRPRKRRAKTDRQPTSP